MSLDVAQPHVTEEGCLVQSLRWTNAKGFTVEQVTLSAWPPVSSPSAGAATADRFPVPSARREIPAPVGSFYLPEGGSV